MKKELIAFSLIVLLAAGSLVNISYLRGFMDSLGNQLALSRTAMEQGDCDTAREVLLDAIDDWLSSDGYTHIFIRHAEIDSTTDAFFDLLSDVCARDTDAAEGAYGKLEAHLASIVGMEQVTLGSIF